LDDPRATSALGSALAKDELVHGVTLRDRARAATSDGNQHSAALAPTGSPRMLTATLSRASASRSAPRGTRSARGASSPRATAMSARTDRSRDRWIAPSAPPQGVFQQTAKSQRALVYQPRRHRRPRTTFRARTPTTARLRR